MEEREQQLEDDDLRVVYHFEDHKTHEIEYKSCVLESNINPNKNYCGEEHHSKKNFVHF